MHGMHMPPVCLLLHVFHSVARKKHPISSSLAAAFLCNTIMFTSRAQLGAAHTQQNCC